MGEDDNAYKIHKEFYQAIKGLLYVDSNDEEHIKQHKRMLVAAFEDLHCEKCFKGYFDKNVVQKLGQNFVHQVPDKSIQDVFMGGMAKRQPDSICKIGGENIVLEYKYYSDNNAYDIRNGVVQLLEYLITGLYDAGILIILDGRSNACKNNLFGGSNKKDEWFIGKMNLAGYPGTVKTKWDEIKISVIRLYLEEKGGTLRFETYPTLDE